MRNKAVIGQQGKFNHADTWQSGARDTAGVAQFGKGHSAVHSQDGSGNLATAKENMSKKMLGAGGRGEAEDRAPHLLSSCFDGQL